METYYNRLYNHPNLVLLHLITLCVPSLVGVNSYTCVAAINTSYMEGGGGGGKPMEIIPKYSLYNICPFVQLFSLFNYHLCSYHLFSYRLLVFSVSLCCICPFVICLVWYQLFCLFNYQLFHLFN